MRRYLIPLLLLLGPLGCPAPEGLIIMPLDPLYELQVNDTFTLELRVQAVTGGETWTFSAPTLPGLTAANLSSTGPTALFRWAPLATEAGDHQITFTVSAKGHSDSETTTLRVVQAGGAPRFLQPPPGGTFDLARTPCVEVNIQVIDEDDTAVTIRERPPLIDYGTDGGLQQTEGFRATWRWCPTPEQVDASLRYTLRLEAQDSTNPPVPHDYEIVLLTEGRADCPGGAPTIGATSPTGGQLVETIRDYEVSATITDDQGFKDMPVLYYSTEAPADLSRPELTSMQNVSFRAAAGDQYVAYIPNLQLAEGEQTTVYYVVRATDNDDPDGTSCDHATTGTVQQFIAAPPVFADPAGYCYPCSFDAQCEGGVCVAHESSSFCGIDCGGSGSACAQGVCEDVASRGGTPSWQCVPEGGADCAGGGGACTDDGYEDLNDTEGTAPSFSVDDVIQGQICPNDEDYYAITLTEGVNYEVSVSGWNDAVTDIDVDVFDSAYANIGWGAGSSDIELFDICPVLNGTHYVWIYGYDYEVDQGPYSLQVTETGESCCTDDFEEENDEQAEAATMPCNTETEGRICEGDPDWWAVTVSQAGTLSIDMSCSGDHDLDLELRDGDTRLDDGQTFGCDESVTANVEPGTYFVRVWGFGDDEGDYTLTCASAAGSGCSDTASCPSGQICDPASGCTDDACTTPGGSGQCPADHFCASPGGSATSSDCVDNCASTADCRAGYDCKVFPEGRGCGQSGDGMTADPCSSFRDCRGQRTCLTAGTTGYCAEINCTSNSDCPTDSHEGIDRAAACVEVSGGQRICLMNCVDLALETVCNAGPGTCQTTTDVGGTLRWVCALPGQL